MAEETTTEPPAAAEEEEMDVVEDKDENGGGKREREEEEENGEELKKQKVEEEKSVEEERLESVVVEEEEEGEEGWDRIGLGPKEFGSSLDMFDYFQNLIHRWPPHVDLNKYEHMVLLELLKKGNPEAEKKIGSGIKAFQIRNHPVYKTRCFFLIREDDTAEDFSFRKCVDHILPLPENLKTGGGGGGGGGRTSSGGMRGGRGRGRGRGRGGRGRGGKARR